MTFHTPASYYDPPNTDAPDEECSACGGDLGDTAYEVRDQVLCESCVSVAGRCDQCGMYRCGCP